MSAMEVSTFLPTYDSATREELRPSNAEQSAAPLSTKIIRSTPEQDDLVASIESSETMNQSKPSLLSEFERLFIDFDYETTREEILERRFTDCHFYTVLWRIFLHCLPRDSSQWDEQLSITRNEYTELRRKYGINPRAMSPENGISEIVNHPLSQHPNSRWRQYHDDADFKKSIEVDVYRTYPNVDFFRDQHTIQLQTEILFTHSRHKATVCEYRQGMHEILGMIVYMLHTESSRVYADPDSNELMKNLYNPHFLEHDSYAMFEKIMVHLRQYYTQAAPVKPVLHRSASMKDAEQRLFEKKKSPCIEFNENVLRMKALFNELQAHDPSLHKKLTDLEIEPTVYGIRWLRLMFSREIPFESIPILWNVIFCFDESFTFVDHFFIALLKQFAPLILKVPNGTDIDCLHILMKPNVIANVEPVIRQALQLAGRKIQLSAKSALAQPIPPTPEVETKNQEMIPESPTRLPKIQRVPVPPPDNPRITRPSIARNPKQTGASGRSTAKTQVNGETKINGNHPLSSAGASSEDQFDPPSALDLGRWSGKTAQDKYDENKRLQETCSQYMGKFVRRLETLIADRELPNEKELLMTVSGLKQIAYVLSGALDIDHDRLSEILSEQTKQVKTQQSE